MLSPASGSLNRLQSTLTWLTLLFLGAACGSVIQAPNLVPEVFTVSGPVIFISFPHAAEHITQLQSRANETTANVWENRDELQSAGLLESATD